MRIAHLPGQHHDADGFRMAMVVCAALAAAGGVLAWLTISSGVLARVSEAVAETPNQAVHHYSCGVAGTPLRSGAGSG